MKGLHNLGNTCYLNAALQCLLFVAPLTNYVLSGWAEKDLHKKRINACALAGEYISLTKAYWGAKLPAVLDPRALWTALCKLHRPFATQQPHDAHEALALVLKHVHDAWVRTPRVANSPARDHVDAAAWEAHLAKDGYSMVSELFVGQTECVVQGPQGYRSVTHEHFTGLSLDLGPQVTTVKQALDLAFAPQTVEGFALPSGERATVTQTRSCKYLPLVLVLHIKRHEPSGTKNDRFVHYSTTLDTPHGGYRLSGVVFHRDGHYAAACEVDGRWYLMDDASVAPVEVNAIVHKDAYVLVYQKRGGG